MGAYIGLCSNSSNFKIPEAEHGNHKIAECLVQMRSLPQISATVSLFLVSLFIVVTMNLTAGELFSQQSGSKSVLLTPDTNDLDGLSGLRAITPVPAIDSNSDPFLASPPDREYREREREREYKEREYRNREYRDYNGGQLEQDDFGRQDRTGDRVNGRRYPVRNYPYNQDDNQQYNNQYNQSDSRNNYQGTGDYVARDRSMQPRKYSPDNQSPAAQPDNSNLGAMQPRNQLSDRSADGSRVVRTANAYPAVGNDSRELMNSGARGGVLRNGTSAGEFSSNRVVPFGGAGGADNLAAGQVEGKQEWYATYENDLPFMRVCGMVVVQANFPLEKVALQLHEIEILQRDLSNYLGLPAPREKIELCLFSDEASYMKFLVTRFSNAPRDRRALYIKK
ncbi:MAG: hypothetical protein LBK06_02405, partial [Planctomycetaceae bacterium]|nr:hypothetical protein [Planctomycetaceae bacterium]